MKVLAILQARMSSSRLPGKVMKPLLGKPMIWHQWQRIQRAKHINQLVLATSIDESDNLLADFFLDQGIDVFRGSLNDVLSRYYHCALQYRPEHIVRLTADCPVADPTLIDEIILTHLNEKNDYTSTDGLTHPLGLSAEICRFEVLESAYQQALLNSEREHVTLYIYQNSHQFKVKKIKNEINLSRFRWTVDHPEDFELITRIYEALYPQNINFETKDILNLLEKNPDWVLLNAHIPANEGLEKSLKRDRISTKSS